MGDVLSATGSRGHGLAILILALPELIPAPIPWLSTILGVPLLAISGHLALFGDMARLPPSFLNRVLPAGVVAGLSRYAVPPLRLAERWSRPRLAAVAERERLIGALCVLVSLILFLPIPFLNGPPATTLILLSWGLIQKDGAFVLLGAAATVGIVVGSIFFGGAIVDMLLGLMNLVCPRQH